MKRNRVFRLLASLTVVVLCMTAFSVTAFAGGGDGDYYTGEPAETTPEPTEEPATGGMEPEASPLPRRAMLRWWTIITATNSLLP